MKDKYAIVMPIGKEPILLHCDEDGTLDLKELQGIVGGYIETVSTMFRRYGAPIVLIVNEEGKLQGLEPNRAASACIDYQDIICGNAILMQAKGENLVGFDKSTAERICGSLK